VIPTLLISSDEVWEGLTFAPCIVTKSQDDGIILRLNEAHASDGREARTAIFQRLFEHSLRTHPRARLGIIVQAAIDDLGRKILRMRRHPEPEVVVALVMTIESPGHEA
jgi:hypothetical protein